jgi:hypothetical protein
MMTRGFAGTTSGSGFSNDVLGRGRGMEIDAEIKWCEHYSF